MNSEYRTAAGLTGKLSKPLELSSSQCGGWFEHNGWRVQVPKGSSLRWPLLPHNPYRKDGRADEREGRIVLTIPFNPAMTNQIVDLAVLPQRSAFSTYAR